MARQDMDVQTFPLLPARAVARLPGVKEWTTIQKGAELRALADELGAGRAPHFTRRPREAGGEEDERRTACAVSEAKRGEQEALRYLYLRYADNVYGYVRSILRDEHEAEDITQQVFAKLMPAVRRYEPQGVPFSRWLLRLAHNAAIDHIRASRSTPVADVRGVEEAVEDGTGERLRLLQTALARVPEDQRHVLVLRHIAGLSPDEIADRLGRTTSSIHSLHHRGRGTLRAALHELGAAPVTLHRAA